MSHNRVRHGGGTGRGARLAVASTGTAPNGGAVEGRCSIHHLGRCPHHHCSPYHPFNRNSSSLPSSGTTVLRPCCQVTPSMLLCGISNTKYSTLWYSKHPARCSVVFQTPSTLLCYLNTCNGAFTASLHLPLSLSHSLSVSPSHCHAVAVLCLTASLSHRLTVTRLQFSSAWAARFSRTSSFTHGCSCGC